MKKSDEKNYLSLTHFFSKTLFLGIGISKVLRDSKESAIFSLILGSLLGVIILYFINKFKSDNNKYKNIIMFILVYILFIIGISDFVNLVNSIYLMDMNKYFIILPLIIIILYMNTKDISIHLKISKIVLIITMFLFIIGYLILIPEINYLNYFPLFNVSIKKILFSSLEFALISTTPNILYSNIKYNIENKNKKIIKNYLISNIVIISIILITQGILGIELVNLFKYPEYVIFKKVNLFNFIQNIENILSFFWLFIIIIYLSICSKELYDISYNMFESKYVYPIFLFISLFILNIVLFEKAFYQIFLYNYLWLICGCLLIIYFLISKKN